MQSTSPATTRLRVAAFAAWAGGLGLSTEAAQAERIGVAQSTLNRVKNDEVTPGGEFIAAVLAATGSKFEDMFEAALKAAS